MQRHKQIHAPLLRLAVCLVGGMLLGVALPPAGWALYGLLVAVLAVAVALRGREVAQSVALCACFVLLGAVLMQRDAAKRTSVYVSAEGVVVSEPAERPRTVAVELLMAGDGRRVRCYVAKDARSLALAVGDGVRVERLCPERPFVRSREWSLSPAAPGHLSRVDRSRVWFLKVRHRLLAHIRALGLTTDDYAVVAAMTLGDKSTLSREVRETFNTTGAAHVLALSGLHLGIIYGVLSLLVVGRRWRAAVQVAIVVALWAFAFLVGLPASVVRSATMISVFALMRLGGRDGMSLNVLAFTAIVMLCVSPHALFEAGFQMSFLAMLGIILLCPLFYGLVPLPFLQRHSVVRWVWGLACVSLVAQVAVAPVIAYYFGRVSLLALPLNFLVVPAAWLVLSLSPLVFLPGVPQLLAAVVGFLNRSLAVVASWPVASVEGLHPSLAQVVALYVLILALYLLAVQLRRR